MKGMKFLQIGLWLAVAIAAGSWLLSSQVSEKKTPQVVIEEPFPASIGGPFELTSHKGDTVSNSSLRGKPYLVFFGFTHCPDICPTTLFELTDLLNQLGENANRIVPLFITVDPDRDTQEQLADYMKLFDNRILALRGNKEQTDAAVKSFASYYRKVPLENGNYTMDHTAGILLLDAEGAFVGTLDLHEPREHTLAKLQRLARD